MSSVKFINRENLKIARENLKLETAAVSKKFSKVKDIVAMWESGELLPSWSHVKKLAGFYNVSELLFFASDPIKKNKSVPDYRTGVEGKNNEKLNKLIQLVMTRQKWLEKFVKDEGYGKNELQGSGTGLDPKQLAKFISEKLEIKISDIKEISGRKQALKYLIAKAEAKRIFVGKTIADHRIKVEDMRGLFISHDYCPFIILNRKDADAAQIFSLAHELSHLFRKSDAVSNSLSFRTTEKDVDPEEIFCNKVAAELLLPENEFTKEFYDKTDIDAATLTYKVSPIFIFYRLKDLGKIRQEIEDDLERQLKREMEENLMAKAEREKKNTGGSYINNMRDSNGQLYNRIVQRSYLEGDMGYVEAANLLRFSPEEV
jgi:Zn-dependent peptidase ImmA (M78 family)